MIKHDSRAAGVLELHLGRVDEPAENPRVRVCGQTTIADRVIVHFCCRHLDQQEPDEAADSWGSLSQQALVLMEDFIPSRFCWSDSAAGNT